MLLPGDAAEAGSSAAFPFVVPTLLTETTVAAGEEDVVSMSFEEGEGEAAGSATRSATGSTTGSATAAEAMTTSVVNEDDESFLDTLVISGLWSARLGEATVMAA